MVAGMSRALMADILSAEHLKRKEPPDIFPAFTNYVHCLDRVTR